MNEIEQNFLMHFGIKKRSGRYKYGSGDRPYQHEEIQKKSYETKAKSIKDADLLHEGNYLKSKEKRIRMKEAADLGLRALAKQQLLNKNDLKDEETYNILRDWFIWEDQTIGYATIADLVNRGKTKEQINKLKEDSHDLYINLDHEDPNRYIDGVFQLAESYGYEDFLDSCLSIKNKQKKG